MSHTYEYQEFPKWTRNGDKERLVHSREELEALGDGWSDHKYVAPKTIIEGENFQKYPMWVGSVLVNSAEEEAALGEPDTDERTALFQIAAEKGVKIDKRWSTEKIRAALEAA
jgi:hypothetical protein